MNSTNTCPASFNSGVMTLCTSPPVIANDTKVGGTSKSSNEPDIESLPPIEGNNNSS